MSMFQPFVTPSSALTVSDTTDVEPPVRKTAIKFSQDTACDRESDRCARSSAVQLIQIIASVVIEGLKSARFYNYSLD